MNLTSKECEELRFIMMPVALMVVGSSHAEDIVQDTLIDIIRSTQEVSTIKSWARAATLYNARDFNRKRNTHRNIEVAMEDYTEGITNSGGIDEVEENESVNSMISMVKDKLRNYPNYMEVLLLRARGMEYGDIAKKLGIKRATVGTRINRARSIMNEVA